MKKLRFLRVAGSIGTNANSASVEVEVEVEVEAELGNRGESVLYIKSNISFKTICYSWPLCTKQVLCSKMNIKFRLF